MGADLTETEAHRNVHRCTNQLFEAGTPQPDPHDCQCYYHCNYRQQPCYMCCPDGQVFSPKLNSCVESGSYACKDKPAVFRCKSAGLFANKEHCRKYWDCSNAWGEPIEEGCPADYHWDDSTKTCRSDTERSVNNKCL